MAVISGTTDSFKEELFRAIHDFGSDTLKIALYSDSASLGPSTTAYTSTGEVTGTGYTAGGATIAGSSINRSGGVSWFDFTDPSWPGASFEARGALIYNTSAANRSIMVLDFGRVRTFNTDNHTVTLPLPGANTALLRIGFPR